MVNELEIVELSFTEIDAVSGGMAPKCGREPVIICAGGECVIVEMMVCE